MSVSRVRETPPEGKTLNRRVMRISAVVGAAALSTLAVAPAFAATEEPVSQASAQSISLNLATFGLINQKVTAVNDGSKENKSDTSTIPDLAALLPDTTIVHAGIAPQDAGAKADGTSYACAGITGPGGGIVSIGNQGCDLDGRQLTLDLANLSIGEIFLSDKSIFGAALKSIPFIGGLPDQGTAMINQLITAISKALGGTPLGDFKITAGLNAISAKCTANPTKAEGSAKFADAKISITLPQVGEVVLVNFPANPAPNSKLVTNPAALTKAIFDALVVQVKTMLTGVLGPIVGPLTQATDAIQKVIEQIVGALQVVLKPIEDYLLSITVNKQETASNGRKITVTALDTQVLPAAKQFLKASLLGLEIGKVSCGENHGPYPEPPTVEPPKPPTNGGNPPTSVSPPKVPTVVAAGEAGEQSNTARNALIAMGALLTLGGAAGAMGYRRLLQR